MRELPRRVLICLSGLVILSGPAFGFQHPKYQAAPAAVPQDPNRAAAERLMTEAAELRKQGRQSLAKALEKYQAALQLWQAASDKAREGSTLGLIGQVCTEMGDNKKALDYFQRAVAASHSAGDLRAEGTSLYGIGLAYSFLGESQKALDYFSRALPLRRAANDRFGEALTLNNLGRTYLALARYQEALESLLGALPIRREIKDGVGEAYTLNAIGSVFYSLGDYKKAIEYYDQALPVLESAKNQTIEAYTLNDMGFNYWMLGDSQKALSYYARALSLWRALDNHQGQAHTLSNTGMAYDSLGDCQQALEHYGQALDLEREVKDRKAEAYTLHNMGDVLAKLGSDGDALERYRQSLAIKQSIEDRDGEAATLAGIARLDRNRGDLAAAKKDIESALDIVESLRTHVAPQFLRASYFGSKSDYYEFYIDLLMRLNKKEPGAGWDIAALQASDRARARSLLDWLGAVPLDISEGIDGAMAGRLRSLQQQLESSATRLTGVLAGPHTEQQAAVARHAVDEALAEYEGGRAAARSQDSRYAALTQPAALAIGDLKSLLDDQTMLLEYSLGNERSFLWAVTLDGVTSFELPGRVVIDRAARRAYDLITARNLKPSGETPEQRRDRLARADAEYLQAARQLSDLVLAPIGADLRAGRLIIVSDGALQYVPFAALPVPVAATTPPQPGLNQRSSQAAPARRMAPVQSIAADQPAMTDPPMLAYHEIVSLPSALVLAALRQPTAGRKPASRMLAVLADPVFQADDPRVVAARPPGLRSGSQSGLSTAKPGSSAEQGIESAAARLGRLRFSRAEAQGIAALVPKETGMIALDFAADKGASASAALGQYRIVHYATHSVVDTEHPELSGIALSMVDDKGAPKDGYLRLLDIYNLKLGADLVVLSACQTALGRDIKREGLMSITRGFMYAGAPRVVSSLWSVDDKATAELMRIFYQRMLVDGLRPAAALREAQLAMWRQQCCLQPYYWAAFGLHGEWR